VQFMLVFNESEGARAPTPEGMAVMGKYAQELARAKKLLRGFPLADAAEGATARVRDGKAFVIDGPFPETKELIAGYWLWKVKDLDEAVEWVKRCPDPMPGEESEIEIRPFYELEDFGAEFTPELQAKEASMRAEIERQQLGVRT